MNAIVKALHVFHGDLVVGGGFTSAGEHVSAYWARWGLVGTSDVAADLDGDCDVDADDFALFAACVTGPSIAYDPEDLPPGCALTPDADGFIAADFDRDGDVDMDDFAVLQRCFSGENVQADPACGD